MLEFREKRKLRRILYSPLTMAVLLFLAIVLVKATWNVYAKAAESQAYLSQAQGELNKVASTQSGLATSVAALQTQEGVETDIRSQFLVAKPGEQVAVIVDGNGAPGGGGDNDDSPDASDTASMSGTGTLAATSSPGFWTSIVDFFKF